MILFPHLSVLPFYNNRVFNRAPGQTGEDYASQDPLILDVAMWLNSNADGSDICNVYFVNPFLPSSAPCVDGNVAVMLRTTSVIWSHDMETAHYGHWWYTSQQDKDWAASALGSYMDISHFSYCQGLSEQPNLISNEYISFLELSRKKIWSWGYWTWWEHWI